MSKMTLKTEGDTHVIVKKALHCTSRSRVPRPYRSETNPEMVAWSGTLDDAGLYQRGEGRRQVPLRMDEWQTRWNSHHGRIRGTGPLQQDRTCRAHAPAGSHARQPY